jgi:succinate dehydrogenase / fumarate reductase cytochrome b subunit
MGSTIKLTLQELIHYRGNWGQWSWVAHRISGLAVLLFLIIHVWDTANATFWPEAYSYTVEVFKWFPFSVGEIALMAAVIFHAINGIRVTILDFKPEWWKYQQQSAIIAWILFAIAFLPIGILMFSNTLEHCSSLSADNLSCFTFPTP